jgi:hypothetical protein
MIFGHQSDAAQPSAPAPSLDAPATQAAAAANPLAADPDTGVPLPVTEQDTPHHFDVPEPSILNQPSAPGFASDPAPTSPFGSDQAASPAPAESAPDPSAGAPMAHLTPAFSNESAAQQPQSDPQPTQSFSDYAAANTPDPAPTADPSPAPTAGGDDLLNLKQQALSQLGPLVRQLDQTPEEKFRTTMMLVQSTDNASLLKDAYEAAQAITDEKVRAQALLDVVNEINYFTQQSQAQSPDTDTQTV